MVDWIPHVDVGHRFSWHGSIDAYLPGAAVGERGWAAGAQARVSWLGMQQARNSPFARALLPLGDLLGSARRGAIELLPIRMCLLAHELQEVGAERRTLGINRHLAMALVPDPLPEIVSAFAM